MRQFTQNLCLLGACILLLLGVAVIFFTIIKFVFLALFCLVLAAIGVFFFWCEIRDYRFYKKLSSDMNGKSLEERLQILNHYEECWLLYATPEEIAFFREASLKNNNDSYLKYLLERAEYYDK